MNSIVSFAQSSGSGCMLGTPACMPRLGTLCTRQSCLKIAICLTYGSVLDPLIFEASRKPGLSSLASAILVGVGSAAGRLSNQGTIFGQSRKLDVVGRPDEEHERPALVLRLIFRWRPADRGSLILQSLLVEDRVDTHTTR